MYAGTVSLTPEESLQPNTNYIVAYAGRHDIEPVSFTTGSGPLTEPPPPPSAFLQHHTWTKQHLDSCDPWERGSCLALPVGVHVELTYIDSFAQERAPQLYTRSTFAYLSNTRGTNFECLKLRTRAKNGTYSDPRVLCAGDGAEVTLGGDTIECTSNGMSSDGDLIKANTSEPVDGEPNDAAPNTHGVGGCSAAPGVSGPSFHGAGLLFACFAAFSRRRTLGKRWGHR